MTRLIAVLLAALALAACSSQQSQEQVKRYPIEGVVKGLDARIKTAVIQAGKIDDWMDAMTMEYQVKPDAEFQKLHVGDRIAATVVVQGERFYVTDVKVVQAQ